jgi:serpin B
MERKTKMKRVRLVLGAALCLTTILAGLTPFSYSARAAQEAPPELVTGNNTFAFDLYHAISGQGDNLVFSPYSISAALAMVYAGSGGNTAQQIADTLHFTLPQDQLPPAFSALDTSLMPTTGEDEEFQLNIANALWGQDGFPFYRAYLKLLEDNYRAGLTPLDFMGAPEPSRETINQWVSDQTEERIKDLIPSGAITPMTRLVLTNAIYFKGGWVFKFDPEMTQDGDFHLLDGSTITTPMMMQSEHFAYAAGEGYQAVELPYQGDRMSMIVLLPDEGNFDTVESGLSAEQFESLLSSLNPVEVNLTMPRFEYTSDFSLSETLAALGMTDAFDPGLADFSGMLDPASLSDAEKLFISDVIHKAFIKLDESGTEAAAATAVIMEATAAPADLPVEFTVDRPFIYLIYDKESHSLLFVGRVLDPTAGE